MNETVTDCDPHTSLELLAIVVPAVAHVVALVLHNPYALSKHAQKSNIKHASVSSKWTVKWSAQGMQI